MIADQPDAGSLLETARRVIKEEILPEVPASKVLDVLMVLRSLEIAARALADSSDDLEARRRLRFKHLLGDDSDPQSLAAEIRAGHWDAEDAARRLHACLVEDIRDRLARVNPRYMGIMEAEE